MGERFVGREQELTAIRELVQRARVARPQPLVVGGASGSGKTMLLGRVAAEAAADGVGVLSITATGASADESFGALAAALVRWGDEDPSVAAPVGAVGHAIGARPHGGGDRRVLVMEALRRLLEATSFHRPVIVAVDDLQLLDDDTVDAVLFLMRHLRRHRVLILATLRTDPTARGDLADDVRRLHDAGYVDALELGPLADAELALLVAATVGHPPDDGLIEILRQRTGGMPFFAAELIAALADGGLLHRADGTVTARPGDHPLPRRVATTVLHRVFMVGADARRVATAVALLGHVPVERLGTLATVTALGRDRTDDAFDRLVRARVLVSDGPTYRFHHVIVRDAVLADLHPAARRRLHGVIARVLVEERRAGEQREIGEICEHLRLAVADRDQRSAELFTEAGDDIADTAPACAAEWYRLALLRVRPDDPSVAAIQVRLGRVLGLAGRPAEAHAVATAAWRDLPPGPLRTRAATVAARGAVALGRRDDAAALLDSAWAEQLPPDPRVVLQRATVHTASGEHTEARRCVDEARALGVPADHPLLLTVLVDAAMATGDVVAAADLTARLRAVAADASPAARHRIALTVCSTAAFGLDPAEAVAGAALVADGEPMAHCFRAVAAWAHLRRGCLDDAVQQAAAARSALGRESGDGLVGAVAYVLARASLERGELDAADAAVAWAQASRHAYLDCAVARLHSARGEHDAAADVLRRSLTRTDAGGRADELALVLAEQVEAAHRAGRAPAMRAANARLQAQAHGDDAIALTMSCLLADALTTRDPDRAMAARVYAVDHGLALDAARALGLAGDIRDDVEALADAHDELGRLGAVSHRARRRDPTAHVRSAPDVGPQTVVRRADRGRGRGGDARGRGAHEPGGRVRVNLSPKTIEVYLSRIYAKTACRSRVELAVAVRAGALASSA